MLFIFIIVSLVVDIRLTVRVLEWIGTLRLLIQCVRLSTKEGTRWRVTRTFKPLQPRRWSDALKSKPISSAQSRPIHQDFDKIVFSSSIPPSTISSSSIHRATTMKANQHQKRYHFITFPMSNHVSQIILPYCSSLPAIHVLHHHTISFRPKSINTKHYRRRKERVQEQKINCREYCDHHTFKPPVGKKVRGKRCRVE
jgi:hypothetical protein